MGYSRQHRNYLLIQWLCNMDVDETMRTLIFISRLHNLRRTIHGTDCTRKRSWSPSTPISQSNLIIQSRLTSAATNIKWLASIRLRQATTGQALALWVLSRNYSGEWMPPAQAGKLFIIAVGGNPFTTGLNGKGGKPDIRNQIARGRKGLAQAGKNLPVAGTRRNYLAIRLLTNLPREIQCRGNRTRAC